LSEAVSYEEFGHDAISGARGEAGQILVDP
jgi:hypothetical protein